MRDLAFRYDKSFGRKFLRKFTKVRRAVTIAIDELCIRFIGNVNKCDRSLSRQMDEIYGNNFANSENLGRQTKHSVLKVIVRARSVWYPLDLCLTPARGASKNGQSARLE